MNERPAHEFEPLEVSNYQNYANQEYFKSISRYIQNIDHYAQYTTYGGQDDSFAANLPKRHALCLMCYEEEHLIYKRSYNTLFNQDDNHNTTAGGAKPDKICPRCELLCHQLIWV